MFSGMYMYVYVCICMYMYVYACVCAQILYDGSDHALLCECFLLSGCKRREACCTHLLTKRHFPLYTPPHPTQPPFRTTLPHFRRSAHLKDVLLRRRQKAAAAATATSSNLRTNGNAGKGEDTNTVDLVVPKYTFTAQYLNHQTKDQREEIKKTNLPGGYRAVDGLHHGTHEPHSLDHMGIYKDIDVATPVPGGTSH